MKPITQAVASIAASILATWLLRRLVLSSDQAGEGSSSTGRGRFVLVIVPITAGNHYHIHQPKAPRNRPPFFGKLRRKGLKA